MSEIVSDEKQAEINPRDWFELKLNNPKEASPAFEYAWCIGPKLSKLLIENDVAYPCLITLVYKVRQGRSSCLEFREISDLADGINMLPFREAGDYKIFCLVAWHKGGPEAGGCFKESAMAQVSLASSWFSYDEKRNKIKSTISTHVEILPYQASEDISIDPKQFAPAPPKWLDEWVNLFGSSAKTVLGWYGKCLGAFTIQPIVIAVLLAMVFLVGTAVILGFFAFGVRPWKIRYGEIFRMGVGKKESNGLFDYFAGCTDSNPEILPSVWWYFDKNGQKRERLEIFLLCQPLWLMVAIIISAFMFMSSNSLSFWWSVANKFFLIMLMNFVIWKILQVVIPKEDDEEMLRLKLEREKKKTRKRIEKYYPEKLEPLTCSSLDSFESIASKKASLSYRLKRRLYKPISK